MHARRSEPTVRDFDRDHIILHSGTNDVNYDRTSSQIAKEVINFALSLKSDKKKISILAPKSDKLNNKANKAKGI